MNFKQYGSTHSILSTTKFKLQGVKGKLKVAGLQQLKKFRKIDFANARLLNTPCGYYIALTCYIQKPSKKNSKKKKDKQKILGLDFGCQTSITDSTGCKMNFTFGESERLKKLQRQLNKRKLLKDSNRRKKLIRQIGKKYQHIWNRKLDIANKYVASLKDYDKVVIQDEQLRNWHKNGHGKAI